MAGRVARRALLTTLTILSIAVISLFAFDGFVPFLSAQTQLPPAEYNWKKVCDRALAVPLRAPTFARIRSEKWLRQCNSEALYYGFMARPDFSDALQCAFYERANPEPSIGDPFYGPGVLMMLYANGKGVPRDYNVAIRFACENTWAADAEMEYRVGRLEHLRDIHAVTTHFDLCDDGTSGLTEGACASVQENFADAKRTKQLRDISDGWPANVRAAFATLEKAEDAFVNARIENEVDLSGTGRAAFQLEEEGVLKDQFLINLNRFAKGDVPSVSTSDYWGLQQTLERVYGEIQSSSDSAWQFGTVKPAGIRTTEGAWLALLEAWAAFGRMNYPHLSTDRIRGQITRLRIHQLQSLIKEMAE